ncbi:hypothetical protein ANN_11766 [Periplaneta americana]|uniref:Uncharacterized protein n=1 Tax=Periplaneta americana TaxID=6978 RepID=A0ABQ8T738_PERAM|nr:hypothetical protein ANN_11766 [Periplaneta americana]
MNANVSAVRSVPGRSSGSNLCRRCDREVETLAHVLGPVHTVTFYEIRCIIHGEDYVIPEEHELSESSDYPSTSADPTYIPEYHRTPLLIQQAELNGLERHVESAEYHTADGHGRIFYTVIEMFHPCLFADPVQFFKHVLDLLLISLQYYIVCEPEFPELVFKQACEELQRERVSLFHSSA